MAYPAALDTFTNPKVTDYLDTSGVPHATQHSDANDAIENIQGVVGTTAGTSISKNFAAGDFAARVNNESFGSPTITGGTIANMQLIGTSQITGGTLNTAVVGTPTITGGQMDSAIFGTPDATGGTAASIVLEGPTVSDILWLNEDANTFQTQGVTLNQGANDDEILSLKSSDVAHPFTSKSETDTYGMLRKSEANSGGMTFEAFKDADGIAGNAIAFAARLGEAAGTAKSTSALGIMSFSSAITDGTVGVADVGSDGNLIIFRNRTTTRFIFDAEGSGHADVEWVAFSDTRLKKDQKETPYGLKEIMKLKPKIYKKHSGDINKGKVTLEEKSRKMIGLIAQEVEEVMPEAIKPPPNTDVSFYSMSYDPIVTTLVRAVQELKQELDSLKKDYGSNKT